MPNVKLEEYQLDAVKRMKNGCILDGGTGTGKSRTALAYVYLKELDGKLRINKEGIWERPKIKKDLYIITTAKKRDSNEWELELNNFGLSTDVLHSASNIKVTIDSWNNIMKYTNVYDSIFIFDEDKVTGSGKWAKSFLKIAKKNRWIVLSATPGDHYFDYCYIFIANSFYRNKTEFIERHAIFKGFGNHRYIDKERVLGEKRLEYFRDKVLVHMESPKKNIKLYHDIFCGYDKQLFKSIYKSRWDPYKEEPISDIGTLLYLLRRVTNEDDSRYEECKKLLLTLQSAIIFYNFSFELEILRSIGNEIGYDIGECNGERHTEIPDSDRWIYICQYNSASEGWNCIKTNSMIFYSLSYSYKYMKQAEGRIDRFNTPFSELNYYYLKSKSPIDIAINRTLAQKKDFNNKRFEKWLKTGGV